VSTPDGARAQSPATMPPPCSDKPQQGEEGPTQGKDTVVEEGVIDEESSEVRGSLSGDGSGEATAQPLADVDLSVEGSLDVDTEAGASGGISVRDGDAVIGEWSSHSGELLEREPVYKKQPCRLCNRGTIYLTRSGLSNHAVVHHGWWYSTHRDEFVPITEEELEEKRRAVQKGQAHRRRRPDPAHTHRQEQASSAGSRKRPFSGTRTPQHKKFAEFVIPKLMPCRQDVCMESTGRETRRPITYAESRLRHRDRGDRRDRAPRSSSSGEYWKSPPSKSRRPEEFPFYCITLLLRNKLIYINSYYRSLPAPKEDDAAGIGWDKSGMIPEEAIPTAEGYEDPDTQPITMDVTTDSPQPMSPNQADASDEAVLVTIRNDGRDAGSVSVDLGDVPSSKQATPPASRTRKSRPRERTSRPREETRTVELTNTAPQTMSASTMATPPPSTSHESETRLPKGRGILRLKAPPKVGRDPTPARQPPPVVDLPLPQWAIYVPPPPTSTPPLENSQLFASQPESSQMQSLDEDYRPLVGTWGDIVEREEQAASAATAAVSAALATLLEPVAIINATACETPTPPVITTVPAIIVTVAPMPIASLLLGWSTTAASTTTVSATVTEPTAGVSSSSAGGASAATVSSAAAASAAPDARRLLNDQDITYAVRLAPAPDAAITTDALMTSFRTTMIRVQLSHLNTAAIQRAARHERLFDRENYSRSFDGSVVR